MIKLLAFDFDGVLAAIKDVHFESLNRALGEVSKSYVISMDEHLNDYDGLPTSRKLEMLCKNKGLPLNEVHRVKLKKQEYTIKILKEMDLGFKIYWHLKSFHEDYPSLKKIVCSNASRETVRLVLDRLNITQFFDEIICNEDVKNYKPHPEIYLQAMVMAGAAPEETLIFEDSPKGIEAGKRSGGKVCVVKDPSEITYDFLTEAIARSEFRKVFQPKWADKSMNILIPMAGKGSRFAEKGYTYPKPLIEVSNLKKPMIQMVVESLNIDAHYIYLAQKEHIDRYQLIPFLNLLTPGCDVISVDGVTEGAACTALLAKHLINNDSPLLIANSDQFIKWNNHDFFYQITNRKLDVSILTFENTHIKWSYAKIDEKTKLVTEVAEKKPISNIATCGIYYWAKGSLFVESVNKMILANKRVNQEFYVAPSINELISDGRRIGIFRVDEFYGVGDPESLEFFINNYKP